MEKGTDPQSRGTTNLYTHTLDAMTLAQLVAIHYILYPYPFINVYNPFCSRSNNTFLIQRACTHPLLGGKRIRRKKKKVQCQQNPAYKFVPVKHSDEAKS